MRLKNKNGSYGNYNWFVDIEHEGQVYSLPRKWDRDYPNALFPCYFYLELPDGDGYTDALYVLDDGIYSSYKVIRLSWAKDIVETFYSLEGQTIVPYLKETI